MSAIEIRAALQKALTEITPALETAWENAPFKPTPGVPYQMAFVLFAEPENPTFDSFKQESGIFQVSLFYPLGVGTAAVDARAKLIRDKFPRASSFIFGGVVVTIERTPAISPGQADGDRWVVPVKIRFYSNIS